MVDFAIPNQDDDGDFCRQTPIFDNPKVHSPQVQWYIITTHFVSPIQNHPTANKKSCHMINIIFVYILSQENTNTILILEKFKRQATLHNL